MTLLVEIGFTDSGANPPFFTLDDATKGILDGLTYVLGGGEGLVDVSAYVRTASVQRGKSRELDRYNAGQATVTFNNSTRIFDPTFEASPFYGQIVPRRRIRVTMDSVVQFDGVIDDWGLEYDPSGYSIATATAFDGFSQLTGLVTETALVRSAELSGARINAILDDVDWSATARDIDTGQATLAAETIPVGTNVLDYLGTIADSEPGDVFINKAGQVEFQDRLNVATSSSLVFSDVSGVGYQGIKAVYGSELLYNSVTVSSTTGTATSTDAQSISIFGQRDLELTTLLNSGVNTLADVLLARYKDPEFRFEGLNVNLDDVTALERADILTLDLSDVIRVDLTPAGIGPTITRYGKVLSLNYSFTPESSVVEIGLESGAGQFLILDDPVFGKLDLAQLGW